MENDSLPLILGFLIGIALFYIHYILLFLWFFYLEGWIRSIRWKMVDMDIKYRFLLLVDKIRVWCNKYK